MRFLLWFWLSSSSCGQRVLAPNVVRSSLVFGIVTLWLWSYVRNRDFFYCIFIPSRNLRQTHWACKPFEALPALLMSSEASRDSKIFETGQPDGQVLQFAATLISWWLYAGWWMMNHQPVYRKGFPINGIPQHRHGCLRQKAQKDPESWQRYIFPDVQLGASCFARRH